MNSALYVGRVLHRRFAPVTHRLGHPLFLVYLDLDDLDSALGGHLFWSHRRPAPFRFHRGDHLGDPARPLAAAVRDLVERRHGVRPQGPVFLLTQLRQLGYVMNPVSFYFVHDREERPAFVVAEVHNTPWGERHCYVHDCRDRPDARVWEFRSDKQFHVSPFMPMEIAYRWRVRRPGRTLSVHLENLRDGARVFDATLTLRRRPLSSAGLAAALLAHPLQPLRVVASIYAHALRLWLKGAPFHPHPGRSAGRPGAAR